MNIINAQDTIQHIIACINGECTDCPYDEQTACREYLLGNAIIALTAQGNELGKALKRINELEEELASRPPRLIITKNKKKGLFKNGKRQICKNR